MHPFSTLSRTRSLVCLLAALILAPIALLPPVLASEPECVPGSFMGSCAFTGATPGGVYVYDTIVIPAGITVTSPQDLVLHARQDLRVEGNIVDTPSITLMSDLTATISGTLRALDGTPSSAKGGDIRVFANLLNLAGTLQSGSGAEGVGMIQDVQDTATAVASVGTPGGSGGDIVVAGTSALLNGRFILGNGGRGGSAVALGGTQSALAVGGAGGASGQLVLPAGYNLLTLANAGLIEGGVGGDGGAATAGAFSGAFNPVQGIGGAHVVNDQGAVGTCGGPPQSSPPGAMGTTGCEGALAEAHGGAGDYGVLRGGAGGEAWARGGRGGLGGRGVDGAQANCVFWSYGQPSCPAYYGGQGGWGGPGGRGVSYGGAGGDSLIEGGPGADATGIGGMGGQGGIGGNSGGGFIIGWNSAGWQTAASELGCMAQVVGREGTTSVIACVGDATLPSNYMRVCGDPGRPGPSGWAGLGEAYAGAHGRSLQGLGPVGDSGNAYWVVGDEGMPGAWGSKHPVYVASPDTPPRVLNVCP
jgi:hypothetical protein